MPSIPLYQQIRSRPGMYIGGLNSHGLRFTLTSIIDELLNLSEAEHPRITLTLCTDGSAEVDAQGAASDLNPEHLVRPDQDIRALSELAFSIIVAAALSDPLDLEVTRAGRKWCQSLSRGVAASPLRQHEADGASHTLLRLRPDPTLFKDVTNNFHAYCGELQAFTLFHPAATVSVFDQRTELRRDYHYPNGLLDYTRELDADGQRWHLDLTDGPDRLRAVIIRRPNGPFVAYSFLNGKRLVTGTHIDSFRQALTELAKSHPNPYFRPHEDPADHTTVVFALTLAQPDYAGCTRECITGPRPKELAYRATLEQLPVQMG